MKILICQKNADGKTIVSDSSATNITDNTELSLIEVGDCIKLLVSDDDTHAAGDELVIS